MTNIEGILSEEEAAELICSDVQTLRRMTELGVGPAHVVLEYKFEKAQLVRFLERREGFNEEDNRRRTRMQVTKTDFFSSVEAAEALGRSERTLEELRGLGHFKGVPARYGFRREDLERFLIPQVSQEARSALVRLRGIEAETAAPDPKPRGVIQRLAGMLA